MKSEIFRLHEAEKLTNGKANGSVLPQYILELGDDKKKKLVEYETPRVEDFNAIKYELQMFHRSIVDDTEPLVPVLDGYNALKVAHEIIDKIEENVLI